MGRGGRVILDRVTSEYDDYWSNLDYTIYDNIQSVSKLKTCSELTNNDTNSVVVALKSDKIDENTIISSIAPLTKHNNHLLSEQMLILSNTNNNTRTNNNHCSNNVINNDKLLNVDRNNVHSGSSVVHQQYEQETLEFGIKKENIDNDYDIILGNYDSVSTISNITNFSTMLSSSSSHNNTVIKTENDNTSSGVSSMLSKVSGSTLPIDGAGVLGSLSNISQMSNWNLENSRIDNSLESAGQLSSTLPKYIERTSTQINSEPQTSLDDILMDVHCNWLHFRPSTPEELSPAPPLFEDIPQYSETTPLCVEVQTLRDPPPPSLYTDITDNVFLSNAFTLSDLQDDPSSRGTFESGLLDASSSSSNGSEMHLAGDSLNELNLSLGETNEDNEKMLDTILQDCQIEDLKSFHTTSNFWNGILEDTGFLNSLDIVDDKNFDKSGYDSELLNELRETKTGPQKRKCTSRIGHSSFSVTNSINDNFFKKESPKKEDTNDGIVDDTQQTKVPEGIEISSSSIQNLEDVKIKLEPIENFIPATNQIGTTNSIYFQNTGTQNLPVVKPLGGGQTENMILLSSSSLRKHMNGPTTEKTGKNYSFLNLFIYYYQRE